MFDHAEVGLAQSLGVTRSVLASARKARLVRGSDWDLVRSEGQLRAQVCYSAAGREKLRAMVGLESGGMSDGSEGSRLRGGQTVKQDGQNLAPDEKDAAPSNILPATCGVETHAEMAPARPDDAPAPIVATITHCTFPNTRLIRVRDAGGRELDVKVRDSRRFKRGMMARVKQAGGWWVLAQAEPRWPGRW